MVSLPSDPDVQLVQCEETLHAAAILDILNHAILHSTALYDYAPLTAQDMHTWFATKQQHGYPIIAAVDTCGTLLGFATWGAFRARPAYKYTVEHSIYVHPDARGRGMGKYLLTALIQRARSAQLHLLVGCIDTANEASIKLHTQLGFTHAGTLSQVGFKFNRWLDAAFYQLTLDTPSHPQDG